MPKSHIFWLWVWGFIIITAQLVFFSECLNSEGFCLLELKNGLDDEYNNLSNWDANSETPCKWKGVTCSNTAYQPVVLSLDLTKMNLSGSLGPSIGCLIHLIFLDVSFNSLGGNIPHELGNCSSLQALSLNDNQFEGPIPASLGSLAYLQYLNLCNNNLIGSIPEEFGNLSLLVEFVAYLNSIRTFSSCW